jgi:hypothetical protein
MEVFQKSAKNVNHVEMAEAELPYTSDLIDLARRGVRCSRLPPTHPAPAHPTPAQWPASVVPVPRGPVVGAGGPPVVRGRPPTPGTTENVGVGPSCPAALERHTTPAKLSQLAGALNGRGPPLVFPLNCQFGSWLAAVPPQSVSQSCFTSVGAHTGIR